MKWKKNWKKLFIVLFWCKYPSIKLNYQQKALSGEGVKWRVFEFFSRATAETKRRCHSTFSRSDDVILVRCSKSAWSLFENTTGLSTIDRKTMGSFFYFSCNRDALSTRSINLHLPLRNGSNREFNLIIGEINFVFSSFLSIIELRYD